MKRILLVLSILSVCCISKAANLEISAPNISTTLSDEVSIGIHFTWEKSWYCEKDHPPFNWDAAWFFVKYRRSDSEDWYHASIKGVQNGSLSQSKIPVDKKGVMVFRNGPGYGTFSDTLTLIWDRKSDFKDIQMDLKAVSSEICVYAVEMVYVTDGLFYLGDGSSGTNYGVYSLANTSDPYPVRGEGAINVGTPGTDVTYKFSTYLASGNIALSANYPKGYKGFYCMKTEITQKQYCDFLNKINLLQIKDDTETIYSSIRLDFGDYSNLKTYGNTIVRDAYGEYSTTTPERACNFLTSFRVLAYLSWAGLRPMSAFEYEKACRGRVAPLPGEYAWGTTKVVAASGFENISNPGEEYYKSPVNSKSNIHISSISRGGPATDGMAIGPGRVGAFANDTTDRVMAGASYYGILDLSGGLAELVVHHWYNGSANFSRDSHGNGLPLRDYVGVATYPSTWPVIDLNPTYGTGYGHRGGHFMCKPNKTDNAELYDPSTGQVSAQGRNGSSGIYYGHIADYSYGMYPSSTVGKTGFYIHGYGGRGVRSF